MEPKSIGEHQKLLTEVIKKQIVILGPDITLAKARNVAGLVVADDGTVTALNGDPQTLTKELINQFMELSGLIVKKTMEPLLSMSSDNGMPAIPMPVAPIIDTPAPPEPVSPLPATPTPVSIPTPETPPAPIPAPLPEVNSTVSISSPVTPPLETLTDTPVLATPDENVQQSKQE